MGRKSKKKRKTKPIEDRPARRATYYDEDGTPSFVVGTLHYTFPEGLTGPRKVRRIESRGANGRPDGWTEMGDADLKFIVPVGDEGSKLHIGPRGVRPEDSSVECLPPKETLIDMEASSGSRSEEVAPSCAYSETSTEVPAPELPSEDSIPPVLSGESGEGVQPGTSPNPRLLRRLARAKRQLADLRSDRRKRRSSQGGLTAEQKELYKTAISEKKEKILGFKLLLTDQSLPDDAEQSKSPEEHSVEGGAAIASLETECGTDGGLGSAPPGPEPLLVPVDGGCGGLEIEREGDAQKAADPAMREESTASSHLDAPSATKKGRQGTKRKKSTAPSTQTASGGLGLGRPARVEADGSAACKAPKVVPLVPTSAAPSTQTASGGLGSGRPARVEADGSAACKAPKVVPLVPTSAAPSTQATSGGLGSGRPARVETDGSAACKAPKVVPQVPTSAAPSTQATSGGLGSGRPARVETDGSAGSKTPKVVSRKPRSNKGLGFPIRLPTIIDLQDESAPVPRVAKPSAAPYQSGLLREVLASQRVPVRPEDMESGNDPENESEQDDDGQDPDYEPSRGDGANEDTSDDEVPKDNPRKGKSSKGADLRGKVTRAPRARKIENDDGELPAVTCPMPACLFSGPNVRRHLRGNPHLFSEAQIQRILKGDVVKKPRRMTKVACPLQGQAMPAAEDRICRTEATTRLDLHLPKHGLSRGTPEWDRVYSTAFIRARDVRQVQGDFDVMVEQFLFRRSGRHDGTTQQPGTSRGDRSALKVFLPVITRQTIIGLTDMGDKDGLLDQYRDSGKYTAKTLGIYLASVGKFLKWLASSLTQPSGHRDRLGVSHDEIQGVRDSLDMFKKTLAADHIVQEQSMLSEEGLRPRPRIEPWMAVAFHESAVVRGATELALLAQGTELRKREMVEVRDTLYTALTLDQIRRAGDVNSITVRQAELVIAEWRRQGCPDNEVYQILVIGCKTTPSGKRTPVNIIPPLFPLFRGYTEFVRKQFGNAQSSQYLIVSTRHETRLQSGSVTKMYRRPWERFAREIGRELPTLSATDNRSMNVTLQREEGAQEGEQKKLASHMSHSHHIQTVGYNCENKVSKRRSIEVSDRQRELRRKAARRELKALERRTRQLRKEVASDCNQGGHSSSEQDSLDDSRSVSDSDGESVSTSTAPRSRGKLPSSSKRRKSSSSNRRERDSGASRSQCPSSVSTVVTDGARDSPSPPPTLQGEGSSREARMESGGGDEAVPTTDLHLGSEPSRLSPPSAGGEGPGRKARMDTDSGDDLFANDAVEGELNEPGVRVKRRGRRGIPAPPLNEPDSHPGQGGSSAPPLNEPDSCPGQGGSTSARSPLACESEGPGSSARRDLDQAEAPIPIWNESDALIKRPGQRSLLVTPDTEWLLGLPQQALSDFLHDTFDRDINHWFMTAEAGRKLREKRQISIPWQMVIEKIRESRHAYGRRLASIVGNTGLQVTEKLRGKIKWLCRQFIDKHGLHDPATWKSWVASMETLSYY